MYILLTVNQAKDVWEGSPLVYISLYGTSVGMFIETYHSVIEQQKMQLNIAKIKRERECRRIVNSVEGKGK